MEFFRDPNSQVPNPGDFFSQKIPKAKFKKFIMNYFDFLTDLSITILFLDFKDFFNLNPRFFSSDGFFEILDVWCPAGPTRSEKSSWPGQPGPKISPNRLSPKNAVSRCFRNFGNTKHVGH